ncbi:MAG: carboxylating nicotinate-nucleotide diphosphorylase [Thermoplasmata archaeon]|nr:carboxylating nicotinate-nucleotide diphosphorylase [Thermoplasmata archaeon]
MLDAGAFLRQDVGRGDITTELTVPDVDGTAYVTCEQDAVIAGMSVATNLLGSIGVSCKPHYTDGQRVEAGTRVLSLSGPLRSIITGERTALDILMRMSGIATLTARAVEKADGGIVVAATRKTTPGFGEFEKEAVRIGRGDPHRSGLDSMIMVKDNHIRACGGVAEAMRRVRSAPFYIKVEVEVSTVEDAVTAAEMGADIIMADNCGPALTGEIRDAVKAVNDRILVEASGGITIDDITAYVGKADIVSMGALTHSAVAVMFSLDIDRPRCGLMF